MIEVKRVGVGNSETLETVTNFEGSPHELILDFVMLQKALKRPKIKLLWEIATLMSDDLAVESRVTKEKYSEKDEELKS